MEEELGCCVSPWVTLLSQKVFKNLTSPWESVPLGKKQEEENFEGSPRAGSLESGVESMQKPEKNLGK